MIKRIVNYLIVVLGLTFFISCENGGSQIIIQAKTTDHREPTVLAPGIFSQFYNYGLSLAMDDEYILVGSPGANSYQGGHIGGAYIYQRNSIHNTWSDGISLTPSDLNNYKAWPNSNVGTFGRTVDICGDYAIVAAPGRPNDLGERTGGVYVYHRNQSNTWEEVGIIASDNLHRFGEDIAMDAHSIIINELSYGDATGKVLIYQKTGDHTWGNKSVLISNPSAEDRFGESIDIQGDYIAVGAPKDDATGVDAGAVYIFYRTEANLWNNVIKLTSPSGASQENFGHSVSINNNYVVVGATKANGAENESGVVYVFRRIGINTWDSGTCLYPDDGAAGDNFGNDVEISGDYIVVGASYSNVHALNSGAAYLYKRIGINSWVFEKKLIPPTGYKDNHFGFSVALSDGFSSIGSPNMDYASYDSGAVYAFQIND